MDPLFDVDFYIYVDESMILSQNIFKNVATYCIFVLAPSYKPIKNWCPEFLAFDL